MHLYIIHDIHYCYRVVIRANNSDEAIEKLHKWLEETKQRGEFFTSNNVKWVVELCDNDVVIE